MFNFLKSSILSKIVVAITGVILVGFVIGHMLGHLQMFDGPEKYNGYAAFLQSLGEILWAVRFVLIVSVLLHIVATINLNLKNRAAKPIEYSYKAYQTSTISSRFMLTAGFTILLFVIYHLMHFTLRVVHTEYINQQNPHDVYNFMVRSFHNPMITIIYILAMIGLGFHLKHGIQSMFQTLGFNSPTLKPKIDKLGLILTIVIIFGYIIVPIAIMANIIKETVK